MVGESAIEKYLKELLEPRGFKVLKLVTPGTVGTPDRLILRPRYWPGPVMVVEVKKPGAPPPRRNQQVVAEDWQARGVHVLPYIASREDAKKVAEWLIDMSEDAYTIACASGGYD